MESVRPRALVGHQIMISVVIPAWNAARYIGDAIESVLSQSAAPDEKLPSGDELASEIERFLRGENSE